MRVFRAPLVGVDFLHRLVDGHERLGPLFDQRHLVRLGLFQRLQQELELVDDALLLLHAHQAALFRRGDLVAGDVVGISVHALTIAGHRHAGIRRRENILYY